MVTTRRVRQPPDRRNREAEVVDAAVQVFFRKGYAASSVQDVADVVGVLKGSLYHYISSKEDLLFRILQESHLHAREIIDEVSALDGAAIERLAAFLDRMYAWYLTHTERVSLYFNQQQHLTGDNRTTILAQARELGMFVRDLVASAKAEGSLAADLDVRLATFFLMGALNGIPTWYRPDGPSGAAEICRRFSAMSMAALGAAARPPAPAP